MLIRCTVRLLILLAIGANALATGTGDPLLDLPASSSPVGGFAVPKDIGTSTPAYGDFTGGDGNVNSNEIVISTTDGALLFYNISNNNGTFAGILNEGKTVYTGAENLTGVAIAPGGKYVLSDGTDIRIGRIEGNTWVDEQVIGLTGMGSNATDVDVAEYMDAKTEGLDYLIVISTESDGIRKVDSVSGGTSLIGEGIIPLYTWQSVALLEFLIGTYDNPLLMYKNIFNNISVEGVARDPPENVSLGSNNTFGIAFTSNAFALIYPTGVALHPPLGVNEGIIQANMRPINGLATPTLHPYDLDKDGDIDGADITLFQQKARGPHVPVAPENENADFDGDGDADMDDFSRLQRCLSGSDNPPDENCS